MGNLYRRQHYDDIASLLAKKGPSHPSMIMVKSICKDFADLFAADNPSICVNCGGQKGCVSEGVRTVCISTDRLRGEHNFKGGFNRERFLAACGLKSETDLCGLCGKPSPDGEVHKDCANYEQALADAQGESQENLEAAEEIIDGLH